MKNVLYLLIIISNFGWASNQNNAFSSANALYRAGKYEQAILYYEAASDGKKKESAELYFNLGNCYYKLHKVGLAVFNYEKAKQIDAFDAEIETNLEFARKMSIDDIKVVPKVGFAKMVQDFISTYHFDTWAWIAVFLSFMFFLFFVGYYYTTASIFKRAFFIGLLVVLFGIIICLLSAYSEKSRLQNENPAIVFGETITVKAEPKKSSQDAFVLHEGTKVFIVDSVANWKKIQLTDETTGWVEEQAIRSLRD